MRANPEKGAEFAAQLAKDENGPLVDIERVSLYSRRDHVLSSS